MHPEDEPAGSDMSTRTAGASQSTSYAGLLLKNRYRIIKTLGSGGFGTVYLARDVELLSKAVVVKVLHRVSLDGWRSRKFEQEKEALARIDHPGVVAILDAGQTPQGSPFLVMQFVDGVTLRNLIVPGGMGFLRAAEIFWQIGDALQSAHDAGICHRDLKPENIMIQGERGDRVRLIDFGVAGVQDSVYGGGASTRIAGTPRYMAPEQFEGRFGPEADVYAFGIIAYEVLTGKSPAEAAGLTLKPRKIRPEIPELVEAVILKALSLNPQERFHSAREMGDHLAQALRQAQERLKTVEQRIVDAAIPGYIVKDQPTELLVLIRRPESPGLPGLLCEEDPDFEPADVRSRPFTAEFPVGSNGRPEPLKVSVSVTSPDFSPGEQTKNIFVPPKADSAICPFILTPRRVGRLKALVELRWEDAVRGHRSLSTECVSEAQTLPQRREPHLTQIPVSIGTSEMQADESPTRTIPSDLSQNFSVSRHDLAAASETDQHGVRDGVRQPISSVRFEGASPSGPGLEDEIRDKSPLRRKVAVATAGSVALLLVGATITLNRYHVTRPVMSRTSRPPAPPSFPTSTAPIASLAIEGASQDVQVLIDGTPRGTTNSAGSFRLDGLSPDEHTITLRKADFEDRQLSKNFKLGQTVHISGPDVQLAPLLIKRAEEHPPAAVLTKSPELPRFTLNDWGTGAFVAKAGYWEKDGGEFIAFPKPLGTGYVQFTIRLEGAKTRAQWLLQYVNESNYLQCEIDDDGFQAVRISDGKAQPLAQKQPVAKQTWYTIRIETRADGIKMSLQNGAAWDVLADLSGPGFGENKFGFNVPAGQRLFISAFDGRSYR